MDVVCEIALHARNFATKVTVTQCSIISIQEEIKNDKDEYF